MKERVLDSVTVEPRQDFAQRFTALTGGRRTSQRHRSLDLNGGRHEAILGVATTMMVPANTGTSLNNGWPIANLTFCFQL